MCNFKNMFDAKAFIRTVYLYLFSLVGLFILIFGSIGMIRLAITTWVFPQADAPYFSKPIFPGERSIDSEETLVKGIDNCQTTCNLSEENKTALVSWLKDYNVWKEGQVDPKIEVSRQRQRQLSEYLAMILIAIPLYLYHWTLIKKDARNRQ
jgi:hypothetical protein